MKDLLKKYSNYDAQLIYFMYYLVEQFLFLNKSEINFEFKNILHKLDLTRYKFKKYINILEDKDFLKYESKGSKYNKENILILNTEHEDFNTLKDIIKMEKSSLKNEENTLQKFLSGIKNRWKSFKAPVEKFLSGEKWEAKSLYLYFFKILLTFVISIKRNALKVLKLKNPKTCIYIIYNNIINYIIHSNLYKSIVNNSYSLRDIINKRIKMLMNNIRIREIERKRGEANMGLKQRKLVAVKKSERRRLESDKILMYPFKLDGNKQIREYGIQKIMKARAGLITWSKVTNRDLASYLVFVSECKTKEPLELHNWQYPRIRKIIDKILDTDGIEKEDWCRVSYYLVDVYKTEFSNEQYQGLNWSFLENSYFRKNLVKKVKEKLIYYNDQAEEIQKGEEEEIKELKTIWDIPEKLIKVQYHINNGYSFNNPPEDYDLKEWNDLCRELEDEGGLIEITVGDKRREKELLNKN